jgi:hypothetical protein
MVTHEETPFARFIMAVGGIIGLYEANSMKKVFTARVWKEGKWFIAQCAQVDVASQGRTEKRALANLREALELYFELPTATCVGCF